MPNYVNFFGTGIRYWICRFKIDEMNRIVALKKENELEWEDVFFDLHVLKQLGYSSIEEFEVVRSGSGWIPEDRNWIEVKRGRKKKKISVEEFLGKGLMFDIYKKERVSDNFKSDPGYQDVLILEKEKGLIGKFELNIDNCDLDRFTFLMNSQWSVTMLGYEWIEEILYEDKKLKKIKEDVVVLKSHAILLPRSVNLANAP